jgi:hypothetical protein
MEMYLEDKEDDEIRASFRRAAFPPTPFLESEVRRRLNWRRMNKIRSCVAAGLAVAVLAIVWQWPRPNERDAVATQRQALDAQTLELPELQVLFASPPVDSLNRLASQQVALVSAVDQIVKE